MNSRRCSSCSVCAARVAYRVSFLAVCGAIAILSTNPAHAADGDFVWAQAMGGDDDDRGRAIAVDAAGNVHITGTFEGTMDFDPGTGTYNLTSAGGYDIFVVKLDSSGDFVWARRLGTATGEIGHAIALDGIGNVYTTGSFQGTVDFDPGPGTYNLTSAGGDDAFVSKLDSSGNFVWARAMGGSMTERAYAIAVDSASNVYTTGEFDGTTDFDPGASTYNLTSAGGDDAFVSKLDSSGNFVWAKSISGTGSIRSYALALDSAGDVHTAGHFYKTADFDPSAGTYNLTPAGNEDVFVCKLDSSGDFVWARHVGGNSHEDCLAISVDNAGNVYATGHFRETVDFDPGPNTYNLTSAGGTDIFVVKLDTSGDFVWAKDLAGTSSNCGIGIAVDSASDVNITGPFSNTVDFDPGPSTYNLTSAGNADVYVCKLDRTGSFIWARAMGGTGNDHGYGLGLDTAGNVCTAGWFQDTADFDPGPNTYNLRSAGSYDVFVSKLEGDSTAPNAITITPTTTGPTNATSVDFTVDFDEDVQNFNDVSDVVITHTAKATSSTGVTITGGPAVYTVTVTGIAGNGSFTLAVSTTSDVQDLWGNALASSVTSAPVTIDNTSASIALSTAAGSPVSGVITVAAALSEASTDFTAGDISPVNATVSGFTGSGTAYSFALTPSANGVFSASVAADAFSDAAGNGNTASNTLTRTADLTPPTATLSSTADNPVSGPITISVALSETSTDFVSGDITTVDATVSGFTGSGTAYSFILTPNGNGVFSASVPAGVFCDVAGNGNTASNTITRTYFFSTGGGGGGCGGKSLKVFHDQLALIQPIAYETQLPTMGATLGTELAVRLRADEPINLDTIEGCDEWQPVTESDGWAVCWVSEDWREGDTITMSVSALTVSGALVGPVTATFVVGEVVREPADIPELAHGVGDVLSVGPNALYKAPAQKWIPLPDGVSANEVELYYYVRSGDTPGWYLAKNVAGWLATDTIQEALIDGVACIGVEVNHGGTVQFALRTSERASVLPTPNGLGGILLCLAMGVTLVVMRHLKRRGRDSAS